MRAFYSVDSTRVNHREYWWGTRSPAVLIGWLLKWLRVRLPSSTDDPSVESTTPFLVEALPAGVTQRFEPPAAELIGKFVGQHGTVSGFASKQGLLVEARWMAFRDASTGLPALLDWLCHKHCRTIKYDIVSPGVAVDDLM